MSGDFIPHKDYKLISFTKDEKNIVKRIKEYKSSYYIELLNLLMK